MDYTYLQWLFLSFSVFAQPLLYKRGDFPFRQNRIYIVSFQHNILLATEYNYTIHQSMKKGAIYHAVF